MVVFTVTSATSGSNIVSIYGIGSPSTLVEYGAPRVWVGGVIKQYNDATFSADTAAYDADAKANVALLAGDGLNVYFVDVRAYVDPVLGMNSGSPLHPNDIGHRQLADAFEAKMQYTPYYHGAAVTAAAFAATPTLCTGGQVPTGILANGNATGCASAGGGGSPVKMILFPFGSDMYASLTWGLPSTLAANKVIYIAAVTVPGPGSTW